MALTGTAGRIDRAVSSTTGSPAVGPGNFAYSTAKGAPLGRVAEPEGITDAVHFRASDADAMVAGTIPPVGGGNLATSAGAPSKSIKGAPN